MGQRYKMGVHSGNYVGEKVLFITQFSGKETEAQPGD